MELITVEITQMVMMIFYGKFRKSGVDVEKKSN